MRWSTPPLTSAAARWWRPARSSSTNLRHQCARALLPDAGRGRHLLEARRRARSSMSCRCQRHCRPVFPDPLFAQQGRDGDADQECRQPPMRRTASAATPCCPAGWTRRARRRAEEMHDAPDDWLEKAEAAQPMGQSGQARRTGRADRLYLSPQSGVMTGSLVDYDQNVVGLVRSSDVRRQFLMTRFRPFGIGHHDPPDRPRSGTLACSSLAVGGSRSI